MQDSHNAWYDLFANFYDAALDSVYRAHREAAVAALSPSAGMSVVDVGCGTGATFPLLTAAVGQQGRVIGVDASQGMLRKAASRVRRQGWQNVELLQVADKPDLQAQPWAKQVGRVDRVLCFLSMSVIPNWQAVLNEWLDALAPGGRLVIADVYNAKPGPYARLVELTARAELTRRSWELLQARGRAFELAWQPSSWVLGGRFFVAGVGN